jgi:hypothetical protein
MIGAITEVPVYFSMIAILVIASIAVTWRQGLRDGTRLLLLLTVLFAVYNAFLIVIYVIHMGPGAGADAHSYFRYMTHLSLLAMLALVVTARDWLLSRPPAIRPASWQRWLPAGAVILALLVPFPFLKRLRFDTQMPQPLIWGLALNIAGEVKDGDRLAILLPGDNGSTSLMLRAALVLTPPRRDLDIYDVSAVPGGIDAGLAAAARRGYTAAMLSCAAPDNAAQLLAYDGARWRVEKTWPYPPVGTKERWTSVLAAAPLCHP